MNLSRLTRLLAITVLSLSFVGCATQPQRQPTPEEQQMQQQMYQAMIERMKAGTARMQALPQNAAPVVPVQPAGERLTQTELAEKVRLIPASGVGIDFERIRDGVKIGGRMYLDPEGEVVNVGSNSLTGEFTYFIRTAADRYTVKFNRANSGYEPVVLGYIVKNGADFRVETVTGKSLAGSAVMPTSRGFIVARDASAFNFDPLKGLNTFAAAEGYHIARFQNGDVSSTGFILLEKDEEDPKGKGLTDSAKGLFNSFREIGSDLGIVDHQSYEYMLANIETGDVVPLDIRTDGKEVGVMSNCRRKNSVMNVCDDVDFQESLYKQNGMRNLGHYFWKVYWFNTPQGAYTVAQEAGLRKVTITSLETKRKVVAFERTLGINGFTVNQTPDGVISLSAQVGFSNETIDDAVAFFISQSELAASTR